LFASVTEICAISGRRVAAAYVLVSTEKRWRKFSYLFSTPGHQPESAMQFQFRAAYEADNRATQMF